MKMRLAELAQVSGGRLIGDDAAFTSAAIDTRQLKTGELFVALPGSKTDGHGFVAQAAQGGAAGALVARAIESKLPQVVVGDVLLALQSYAAHQRARFAGPVLAVTGSNGKTTTKQMLAAILAESFGAEAVLYTEGNLNNHIGVPLTLLRLGAGHRAAVIELGANHAGEIAQLASIAKPLIGLVTLAGAAHLEGFGNIAGVAQAKGELFAALPANGTAVINADDQYADLWRGMAGHCQRLEFGFAAAAGFRAREIRDHNGGQRFLLVTPNGEIEIRLPLLGRHNVQNALGAAAAAQAAGADLAQIARGLAAVRNVGGRLAPQTGLHGAAVVDDSYNANPTSMRASLEWLAAQSGRRWFAMGDMAELGIDAASWHRQIGEWARANGIERLFALGPLSQHAVRSFGAGARHFASHAELAGAIARELTAEVTVLVKGSRSAQMERVAQLLLARPQVAANGH